MNYKQQIDDPNLSGRASIANMDEKESMLSEGTQQSSVISQERNQKINDQFQKKKLEFYKMYNKNPNQQKDPAKPRQKPNSSQSVSYKVSNDRHIREALEIASGEKEAEQDPAAEDKEQDKEKKKEEKEKQKQSKEKEKKEKKEQQDKKKSEDKDKKDKEQKAKNESKNESKDQQKAAKEDQKAAKEEQKAKAAEDKQRAKEEKAQRQKEAAIAAAAADEKKRQEKMQKMKEMEEQPDLDETDKDLRDGRKSMNDKVRTSMKKNRKKADKFCNKFCFTFWVTFPSVMQTIFLFSQEIINIYIVGRSGDYQFIDVVGMSNILVYFIVFGTAIVFNSVLETLVPHALATNRVELSGHILNRGLFLWTMLFGCILAAAMNSGFLLSKFLEQDEEDAYMTQEYLVHLCPSLWFWGICDAYRRFFNCFHKFWTPCFTYFFTIMIVHPLACYQCVEVNELGAKGLAIAGFITNFLTYLILRTIQHVNVRMKPASFCPTFKTCCNLCQYMYYGIPQLIMFWIDTWQWQLLAFVTGWFGVTEQYTTITLLGLMMFCLIPGYSLASTSATLCGQEIGCANVTAAKYYYRSVLFFQILISIFECIGLQVFMGFFLDEITDDLNMQDTILTVYQLFIFNVFLDSIRAMLKGFLRGLGIQNSVLPYHILIQGGMLPGGIFVMCFNMPAFEEVPILGAWISATVCDFFLFIAYFVTLQRANWHEIGINVVKRVNQIAGAGGQDEMIEVEGQGDEIEMQKGLM